MRSARATYDTLRAEHAASGFLRTHVLRPTWHFVAPDDLRWLLELTSPRVISAMTARTRFLGLDDNSYFERASDMLDDLLGGKNHLTRKEIGEAFLRSNRLPHPGEQLGHFLLLEELRGHICSGPTKGVQHSYLLTDDVVPLSAPLDSEEALVRLVLRFFSGHGPASVNDFTRWSSQTVNATRAALAETTDSLDCVDVDGVSHYFDPSGTARARRSAPRAFLFPVYDELVLTYRSTNFPSVAGHPHAGTDPHWAPVVCGHRNVGSWKRTVTKDSVLVELRLAKSMSPDEHAAVDAACLRMARFYGRELERVEVDVRGARRSPRRTPST